MPSNFLLDTHLWIWLQEGDSSRLRPKSVSVLVDMQRKSLLNASVISIWEIAHLLSRGRLSLSIPLEDWLAESWSDGAIRRIPISQEIAIESTRLPGTLHRDPADRFLVATARVEDMTLLTSDEPLLAYAKQGHLRARRV